MLLEISGEITPERMEPKQKQYPVVDATADRSKVRCCKEQYCIGIWNVRSTNQGKLEVVKQEMARVNVDILGDRKSDEPCHVGPPKTNGSWWRVLTKCSPLEKGMANHFSILALRTP